MDKQEILDMAKKENKGKDIADLEAQKKGAWYGYLIGIIGIILVDVVNGFVFHTVNRGADFVICLMAFVAFLVKYICLRKKHELVVSIIYLLLSVMFLTFWMLQLCKVW